MDEMTVSLPGEQLSPDELTEDEQRFFDGLPQLQELPVFYTNGPDPGAWPGTERGPKGAPSIKFTGLEIVDTYKQDTTSNLRTWKPVTPIDFNRLIEIGNAKGILSMPEPTNEDYLVERYLTMLSQQLNKVVRAYYMEDGDLKRSWDNSLYYPDREAPLTEEDLTHLPPYPANEQGAGAEKGQEEAEQQ